jgi:DNA-directed RNA polymerase subunit N (RpoN/RPB10)
MTRCVHCGVEIVHDYGPYWVDVQRIDIDNAATRCDDEDRELHEPERAA